ncbi:MAG: glycosylase, partial [Defluviitaleaceae bacterium]|nr:glycosylase [Defluviitaleaceae bacterium]
MGEVKILGETARQFPWQDKPAKPANGPIWRYSENPVIDRNPFKGVARVFNSAIIACEGGFVGVFRGERINGMPYLYLGESDDGLNWSFDPDGISFVNESGEPFQPECPFDPRLVKIEDTYYIIWCQMFYGSAVGMARTTDFKTFTRVENPFLPYNRNAVLFPRKIGGKFMMLSRPSDSTHTRFGDIFLSESPDMLYW